MPKRANRAAARGDRPTRRRKPKVAAAGPKPDAIGAHATTIAPPVPPTPTGDAELQRRRLVTEPNQRRLRIFAFDPSLAAQMDTSGISEITLSIRWEGDLQPGPIGEYLEVVDVDPPSGKVYRPVDLNERWLLAQNGLAPSETNPLFHQQMVYAVAMATIEHFEQALGRVALWSSAVETAEGYQEQFVQRLRIYPHALRDRNAFYSPEKKALLFGYFPVGIKDATNTPGTLVFSCLSHDIIAHETTHALLDGVHPRFNEPVNLDVFAFHEAFADIVALFQHFSYPGVLRNQINRTRGNLETENLLGQLAQQFGRASGRGRALRDALGETDPETGRWKPKTPDFRALDRTGEPHERGAILVAAVFGAFLKVYRARTLDLFRIASEGTGVLREGEIPQDLANRLADEAARTALYVLQMCIRAIDYCPPVGITFGDYLRAIVTADYDLNPDDTIGYRLAFVESFRQWGIHPVGMNSMSIEALLWPTFEAAQEEAEQVHFEGDREVRRRKSREALQSLLEDERPVDAEGVAASRGEPWFWKTASSGTQVPSRASVAAASRPERLMLWNLDSDRFKTWKGADKNGAILWSWLMHGSGRELLRTFGLVAEDSEAPPTVYRSRLDPHRVAVEVHSVRTALRRGPRGGAPVSELVVEITQRRRGYYEREKQKEMDRGGPLRPEEQGQFTFRTGCTLLIDPLTMAVRRVIRTPGTIADDVQLEHMRHFLADGGLEPPNAFARAREAMDTREPFALLHRDGES